MVENQVDSCHFSYVNNAVLRPSKMKLIKFQWMNQMLKNQSMSGPSVTLVKLWNFPRCSNDFLELFLNWFSHDIYAISLRLHVVYM